MSQTIGFIGLGAMGMGMAKSLVGAGFQVQGFDINAAALTHFTEAGGTTVDSAAAAASGADLFIIVVVNAEQADSVLWDNGAAAQLSSGSVVLLCSTVKPAYAVQTARKLQELGIDMLDSPISGGSIRANAGEITIMASGPDAAFAKAQSAMEAMAANIFQMGSEPGQGSTMKLVNQILAGTHIAVAAEALAFGAKAGIDPCKIYDVISTSAGNSFMFGNRVPHILEDDYTPHSAVNIWVKDLDLVLQAGKENQAPLPLSSAAYQLYMMAAAAGFGALDDAAIVKVFEKLGDFRVMEE